MPNREKEKQKEYHSKIVGNLANAAAVGLVIYVVAEAAQRMAKPGVGDILEGMSFIVALLVFLVLQMRLKKTTKGQ